MNSIEKFNTFPKIEKKKLWKAAVNLYKTNVPKAFYLTLLPSGIGGGLGGYAAVSMINNTDHWTKYLYFICITGVLGGIGGYISSKILRKNIGPYLDKVIKEKEKE